MRACEPRENFVNVIRNPERACDVVCRSDRQDREWYVAFARRERKDDDAALAAPRLEAESDTGLFAGRAEREVVERARRRRAAIPARLVLDTMLTFAPDRVIVVTFDADRRVLDVLDQPVAVGQGGPPGVTRGVQPAGAP